MYFKPRDKKNQHIPPNVPSPFKKSLFWPNVCDKTTKTRKPKEKLPAVATSEAWKTFQLKKQLEKEKLELEKQERKRKREDKKKETEKKKLLKKKIEKDEWSSDSSIDMILESEDESEEKEGNTSEENFEINDFVIVSYEAQLFPGKIKLIIKKLNKENKFFVSAMCRIGNNWKWPEKEDCLWYDRKDVIKKISSPQPINRRGAFKVPEID